MMYCARCVMPDTNPDLFFDQEDLCSSCRTFEKRHEVDWKSRGSEILNAIEKYRSKDSSNWDRIVPVSGDKDRTYQVLKVLHEGLNPLCVTAMICHLSDIGRRNIENIKSFGVDYVEFSPNIAVRRKL